jgi:hypothetical protein
VRPDIDFRRDVDADRWVAHVRGVDVVVNAVGVFASASDDATHDVHVRAPIALFEACAREGVRVVQVSALGADEHATSRFHRSKRAADDHLRATHRDAVVLQPSLVYGRGGASASMLGTLASLPLVPLPGGTLGPLRLSLAAVWLATAAVTLFAYPMDASVAMVERTGLHGPLAVAAVYAGAVVDAAFGVATLVVRRARWLWIAQAAVILAYSAIIAVALPEYLVHPFGPLTKNLPILAVLAMLYAMERR